MWFPPSAAAAVPLDSRGAFTDTATAATSRAAAAAASVPGGAIVLCDGICSCEGLRLQESALFRVVSFVYKRIIFYNKQLIRNIVEVIRK